MGLSRRQFSKEFKLAAVRRLEQGVSMAEAARALEVNPNVLHRWRREFRRQCLPFGNDVKTGIRARGLDKIGKSWHSNLDECGRSDRSCRRVGAGSGVLAAT